MYQYMIRRLLQGIPVILVVTLLIFIMINLAPGDPLARLEDPTISKEDLQRRYEEMGLNDPLMVRYARWLGKFITGDMGYSMDSTRRPVANMISERVIPTLYLTIGAMIVSIVVAIPIGIISATRQYSIFDYIATFGAFLGVSMPSFFLGLLLLYIFALKFPIFPVGGFSDPMGGGTIWTNLHHAVLPVLALGMARVASMTRYMRSSMLEVIKEDYIRTARAKGLTERVVIYKHAFRNALLPIITLIGLSVPMIFGGSVIIEEIFSWPGMGRLLLRAVWQRNYTVILGGDTLFAIFVFLGNLLADFMYAVVDPRIQYD
ncbi:MAG: ABC transporter permease [Halanaerobiales bacterium]